MDAVLRVVVVKQYKRRALVHVRVDRGTMLSDDGTLDRHFSKKRLELLVPNAQLEELGISRVGWKK